MCVQKKKVDILLNPTATPTLIKTEDILLLGFSTEEELLQEFLERSRLARKQKTNLKKTYILSISEVKNWCDTDFVSHVQVDKVQFSSIASVQ